MKGAPAEHPWTVEEAGGVLPGDRVLHGSQGLPPDSLDEGCTCWAPMNSGRSWWRSTGQQGASWKPGTSPRLGRLRVHHPWTMEEAGGLLPGDRVLHGSQGLPPDSLDEGCTCWAPMNSGRSWWRSTGGQGVSWKPGTSPRLGREGCTCWAPMVEEAGGSTGRQGASWKPGTSPRLVASPMNSGRSWWPSTRVSSWKPGTSPRLVRWGVHLLSTHEQWKKLVAFWTGCHGSQGLPPDSVD